MSIYVNICQYPYMSIYVNIRHIHMASHHDIFIQMAKILGGISMVETMFRYTTILSRWQVLDLKAPSPANLPLTTGDWTRSAQDSWYLLMMAYSWTNGSLLRCAKNTTVQQSKSNISHFWDDPPIHHRIRKIHQGTWHRAAAKQLRRTHLLSAWPRLGTLW